MVNGPLLVTERLILRPPATEDFDGFAEMCAEEETMRFIGGTCPRSQAWRMWCTLAGAWLLLLMGTWTAVGLVAGVPLDALTWIALGLAVAASAGAKLDRA